MMATYARYRLSAVIETPKERRPQVVECADRLHADLETHEFHTEVMVTEEPLAVPALAVPRHAPVAKTIHTKKSQKRK